MSNKVILSVPEISDGWSINESLLQSYRGIFINSQAIILALGAILFNKNNYLTVGVAVFGLVQIWPIWFGVTWSRAKIVDFYKYRIGQRFDPKGKEITDTERKDPCFVTEENYVKIKPIRKRINAQLGIKTLRKTRKKIDLLLPIIFTVMWIALSVADWFID